MKFTGERVIPGEVDADLFNEHRARYLFARQFSAGKIVLDAACGAGYGSALLGENAKAVYGMDLSREAADYAREHYGSPKVQFGQGDCLALPFPSGHFEMAVAFEIIEHLDDPGAFLRELRRVLSPSGLLVLSTPNRLYYTDDRGEQNPFHRREFSYPELEEILRPVFPHRSILFENHIAGVLVSGPGAEPSFSEPRCGSLVPEERSAAAGQDSPERAAHFFVALCSAQTLKPPAPLFYLPSTGNVLREREIHIRRLTEYSLELEQHISEQAAAIRQREADIEEKVGWALKLQEELEQARSALRQLQQEFEERTGWAMRLQEELEQARSALRQLQQEFEERTAWALRLDAELNACRKDLSLLYSSAWYRIGKNLRLSPVPPSDPGESNRGGSVKG